MKALISDLLDYKLNRVTIDIPDKDGTEHCSIALSLSRSLSFGLTNSLFICTYALFVGGLGKKKTYDLNTHADPFLNRYASSPFPEAIEANEKELAEV